MYILVDALRAGSKPIFTQKLNNILYIILIFMYCLSKPWIFCMQISTMSLFLIV